MGLFDYLSDVVEGGFGYAGTNAHYRQCEKKMNEYFAELDKQYAREAAEEEARRREQQGEEYAEDMEDGGSEEKEMRDPISTVNNKGLTRIRT